LRTSPRLQACGAPAGPVAKSFRMPLPRSVEPARLPATIRGRCAQQLKVVRSTIGLRWSRGTPSGLANRGRQRCDRLEKALAFPVRRASTKRSTAFLADPHFGFAIAGTRRRQKGPVLLDFGGASARAPGPRGGPADRRPSQVSPRNVAGVMEVKFQ
jgi:hypothetical protein